MTIGDKEVGAPEQIRRDKALLLILIERAESRGNDELVVTLLKAVQVPESLGWLVNPDSRNREVGR